MCQVFFSIILRLSAVYYGVGWWNDKNHIITTPPGWIEGLYLCLFHIRTYT